MFRLRTLVLSGLCLATSALAETTANTAETKFIKDHWSIEAGFGLMSMHAKTEFFDPSDLDYRMSLLDWNASNVTTLNTKMNWQLTPKNTLSLYGDFSLDGNGQFNDYYYAFHDASSEYYGQWTNHVQSSAFIRHASRVGLSFSRQMYKKKGLEVSALLNYQRSRAEWESYGGSYVSSDTGFRADTGQSDMATTGYVEHYQHHSLGLGAQAQWLLDSGASLHAKVIVGQDRNSSSRIVNVETTTVLNSKYDNPNGISYHTFELGYSKPLNEQLALILEYAYTKHDKVRGSVERCFAYDNDCVDYPEKMEHHRMSENHMAIGLRFAQ